MASIPLHDYSNEEFFKGRPRFGRCRGKLCKIVSEPFVLHRVFSIRVLIEGEPGFFSNDVSQSRIVPFCHLDCVSNNIPA